MGELGKLKTEEDARLGLRAMVVAIVSSVCLALFKAFVGIMGNSYALIADAIESTMDIMTSLIVFIGLKITMLQPDENHPYGHGKAEPISAIVVSVVLFVTGILVVIEGIGNLFSLNETPADYTLYALVLIILVKELLFRYVKKKAEMLNSQAIAADAWHHRVDAISSLVALIGVSISIVWGDGFEAADEYAGIVASGIIFFNSVRIFKPAFNEIMDSSPSDKLISEIKEIALKTEGVIDIDKCRVRKMGLDYFVDLHVVVDGSMSVKEGHRVGHEVKNTIMNEKKVIRDVLTHIEPFEIANGT